MARFLDDYASGAVHWAWQEDDRYGWAPMRHWKKRPEWQGRRLAQMEQELNTSNQARRQLLAE